MFEILKKEELAPEIYLIEVKAEEVAKKALPGQFVIIRVDEVGERIPLTIVDFKSQNKSITLVFQAVGKTTKKLASLKVGDKIVDLVGPLGKPTEIKKYGKVICVAGGIGAAPIFPIARELKRAKNYVITILGARSKELLILEGNLLAVSHELHITTDDGSKGRHGLVTDALKELIKENKVDLVIAIGPAIMMKFVSEVTKPEKIKTIVSLNPIMVDGTGMCGACRVEVGEKTKFCCVDGPDFDGHLVDWNLLLSRQKVYLEEEKIALESLSEKAS